MDMRKILRKYIIPEEVKKLDFRYYPRENEYDTAELIINLHKDKGTYDAPNYDLRLSLDQEGRIIGTERWKSIKESNISWFIPKYPAEIDEKATRILLSIVSTSKKGDYSSLIPVEDKNNKTVSNSKKSPEYWYSQFIDWLDGNNEEAFVGEISVAIRSAKIDIQTYTPRIIERFEVMRLYSQYGWVQWLIVLTLGVLKDYLAKSPLKEYLISVLPYIKSTEFLDIDPTRREWYLLIDSIENIQ